jgi:hypothetical protein
MFAKTIVLSDAFLDMPLSTRCLYFTLGMLGDDDGFINSPKSVMRQCGASLDDLNLLVAKKFIIPFDNGVVVIKHWRIHNYIQKDRYKGTKYIEEKNTLAIDEKGAYTTNKDDVSILDTQVRLELGKASLGKSRLVEVSESVSENNGNADLSTEEEEIDLCTPRTSKTFEFQNGSLGRGVVLLTPEQDEALLDKLGFDGYNHYVSKLADFIIKNDAKVGNHYATILKWVKEDSAL